MNPVEKHSIHPFRVLFGTALGSDTYTATLIDSRDGSEVLKVEAQSYASAYRILSAVADRECNKIRRTL